VCVFQEYANPRRKLPVAYLLVEESPEHGQGDVEEQNLQHHLYLGNQKFLEHRDKDDNSLPQVHAQVYTGA